MTVNAHLHFKVQQKVDRYCGMVIMKIIENHYEGSMELYDLITRKESRGFKANEHE